MKYLGMLVGAVVIVAIFIMGFVVIYEHPEEAPEDISSYDITNRHECYQIRDNQKYNECLSFYLANSPYRDNEKLVATRLV